VGADGERKVVVEAGHLQAYPDKEQCLMSVLEGCCRQNRQRAHRGLSPEIRYIYSTATFTLTNF
jgi:hypothetical protein